MRGFCLLIVFLCTSLCGLQGQVPVLLRLVKAEQHDTIGFNAVTDITRIAYKEILAGRKFWDSPQKEIQITGVTLKEIERSTETAFLDQPVIYIYEYWSGNGKSFNALTGGFGFFNKTKSGEEISYGYMDYKDLQDVAYSAPVICNANGTFNTTLSSILSKRQYYFHVVQYGNRVVSNIDESERIKEDISSGTFVFTQSGFDAEQKLVQYEIDSDNNSDSKKYLNACMFLKGIEDFLLSNKEVFFNIGGDKIADHVTKNKKMKVNRVVVKEVWKKINGQLSHDPVSVRFFVNDSALSEIAYRDMIKMDVSAGLKSWIDFIKEKEFTYTIVRINDQPVKRSQAYLYQKGLLLADWKHLTEYIRQF